MNDLKPYDWAKDSRALSYTPSRPKYLCPQGHECYESEKKFMSGYVLCWECDNSERRKGLYTPIYMCKELHETKWKGPSKIEVIVGDKIGQGGPHPYIKHEDEIEMFPEEEFNELKKKLNI